MDKPLGSHMEPPMPCNIHGGRTIRNLEAADSRKPWEGVLGFFTSSQHLRTWFSRHLPTN